jgi:aspartate racemase
MGSKSTGPFLNQVVSSLLNIVDVIGITLAAVPCSIQKLTILGTRPTLDSEIFQQGLARAGLEYVLHPDWQKQIDAIIFSIKTEPTIKNGVRLWEDLSESLVQEGIGAIVFACTDLSILFEQRAPLFQVIDSSTCLAEAVVNEWVRRNAEESV